MRSLLVALFSFAFIASFAQVYPDGSVLGNMYVMRVPIGASSRTPPTPPTTQALVYTPAEYWLPQNANKKYAILYFLHGAGQAGTDKNISKLLSHSLTKMIANGFKPYGIDEAGDTIKFIVVAPQVQESNGGSYSAVHLRYIHPAILKRLRVDQTLMIVAGVSAGGAGAISVIRYDTTFSRQFAGIQIMAGVNTSVGTSENMTYAIQNGVGILHNWGNIDGSAKPVSEGYATAIEAAPPQANRYYKYIQSGVDHSPEAWDPPTTRDVTWFGGLCSWDRFVRFRRTFKHAYVHSGYNDTITTNSIVLTGEEFPPAGVTVTNRVWTRVVGATSMTISNANTLTPTFGNLFPGYYRVRMTTTFSNGTTAFDETEILVNAPVGNVPPVANAGTDKTLTLPTNSVAMTGGGTDSDGSVVSYSWTKISGPTSFSFSSTSIATPTVSNLVAGTYVFQLTVTDNNGATHSDQVTVTVSAAPVLPDVREVVISEYKVAFIMRDSTVKAPFWASGGTRLVDIPGGHKFAKGDGGLYNIMFLKANGDVYVHTDNTNNKPLTFLDLDDAGQPFKAIDIECYLRTYIAVRDDSTIWARSFNTYKWFGGDEDSVLSAWSKIPGQPAGVKFVKVTKGGETGSGYLVAIDKNGNVWLLADNSNTWVQKSLPGAVSEVHASLRGFYIAIIGGLPYGWGEGKYLGRPAGNISTYEPLADDWALAGRTIIDMAVNDNTTHYIDNLNDMYTLGDNAQGELGLGWEMVNRKELWLGRPNTFWYVWDWKGATQPGYLPAAFVSIPQHVTPGRKYQRVFSGNYYAFYKYAQELGTGNLYNWGRNKGSVLINGRAISNESAISNAIDVLTPTLVDLATVTPGPTTFIPGSITAGPDHAANTSTTLLEGFAQPSRTSTWSQTITAFQWTKISGPTCTIVSPANDTTQITGMSAGTYTFVLKATDDNTATMTDTVVVTVALTGNLPPTANAGPDQIITLPTSTATLVGSGQDDGSIVAYEWAEISGAGAVFSSKTVQSPTVTFLTEGEYVFRLTVTDNNGATGTDDVKVTVINAVGVPTRPYILIRSVKF